MPDLLARAIAELADVMLYAAVPDAAAAAIVHVSCENLHRCRCAMTRLEARAFAAHIASRYSSRELLEASFRIRAVAHHMGIPLGGGGECTASLLFRLSQTQLTDY